MEDFKSKEQQQVFLGTLLGDGCLFKSKANINYRMNLAHSLKQKDYFLMKYKHLEGIVDNGYKEVSQYDKRTKKTYHAIKLQSRTNKLFTHWHNKLYDQDGVKHVSKEYVDMLDELALAILYFDDGWRETHCEAVNITMLAFDEESIRNIAKRFEEVFDIKVTVKMTSSRRIRIPTKYGRKFKDSIQPYATSSVLYKLI